MSDTPLPDKATPYQHWTLVRAYAHYIRQRHGHPPSVAFQRAIIATDRFVARHETAAGPAPMSIKLKTFPALEALYRHYLTR
jgi:hypothetical protein